MLRKSLFALMFASILATAVFADTLAIGSKLEDFTLKDPKGKAYKVSELKGEHGTLFVFLSAQCPVVSLYNDRINALASEYAAKGIPFVGLYSNDTECLNWVKHHSSTTYKFKTLVDEGHVIADRFGAEYTPEIYYFDASDKLVYHGAIDDDRYGREITRNHLKIALDEQLAGKAITRNDIQAFGCSIKREAE
ncbi:MAG: redoxin domain-containing protein [Pyrinomonadaceae bacterium]